MIYLGNKPIGLLAVLPEWAKINSVKLEFNQYQSFDTAILFFNDIYVKSVIDSLPSGTYKIIFENNTTNTRAGEWIIFTNNSGTSISNIQVKRIGLSVQGSGYGVDVYEGAEGIIYQNTKEVTPNA